MENKRFTYGLLGVLVLIVLVAAVSPAITGEAKRSMRNRWAAVSPKLAKYNARAMSATPSAASSKVKNLYATAPPVEEPQEPQEVKWCQETDNGKDYGTKGVTSSWNGTETDSCLNQQTLREWYCNDDQTGALEYKGCRGVNQGNICNNGACV